jgi:acetyltransferase-like isoleucine patch superfamily enzyme
VPVGPAVVQRQLPAGGCCVGVPIRYLVKHASLRDRWVVDWRYVRGRWRMRYNEHQQLQPGRLGYL